MSKPDKQSATILKVEVELADYWGSYIDEDGERAPHGDKTDPIMVAVVNELVRRVTNSARTNSYGELDSRVRGIRAELIREKLEPIITEAIETPTKRTNRFGEETCDPITIRTMVLEEARNVLSKSEHDRYDDRKNGTLLERTIKAQVLDVFGKELKAEIDKAKAEATKAVREQAAMIIADTITKMAGAK